MTPPTPPTPPPLHPFNLTRALAGEAVVTRNGRLGKRFRQNCCWKAGVFTLLCDLDGRAEEFKPNGCFLINDAPHDNDLFMASEAVDGKCAHSIAAFYKSAPDNWYCVECKAGMGHEFYDAHLDDRVNERRVLVPRPAPPSPEPEAQGRDQLVLPTDHKELADFRAWCKLQQELAAEPQTELDRQIEVMKASRDDGVVIQWRMRNSETPDFYDLGKGHPFNWRDYDYRIRPQPPAPQKARRVWLKLHEGMIVSHSWTEQGLQPRYALRKNFEFIELTPAIRAALEEKGMM
jgi:hypothetical protein